jgi:hypothetical protein
MIVWVRLEAQQQLALSEAIRRGRHACRRFTAAGDTLRQRLSSRRCPIGRGAWRARGDPVHRRGVAETRGALVVWPPDCDGPERLGESLATSIIAPDLRFTGTRRDTIARRR